ncbi:hypothetical protein NONO_c14510 [Nocardia nova SH22a]|uniref:Uncharacterized protein n=1 Tax=Nocardia nova SH22a TaxID=1415166 RepID=W5TAR7_9NOCA|nr:hypothetical protein [Nocardia nova]AHH16254.1 hypothetical protein NONO_c14510 [Nocardia nova SH22a]
MIRSTAHQREQWDIIHRFCDDCLAPIASLEEARRALTVHAGHGLGCLQYLAALSRVSEVMA